MQYISVLLPFLLVGLGAAFLCRFTGLAISFVVAPALLVLGAKPTELVAFLLTFLVYHNFTQETQYVRIDFKNLLIFGGWKKYALLAVVLILALFVPFLAVLLFLIAFVVELTALLYMGEAPNKRPSVQKLIVYFVVMSLAVSLGIGAMHFIPIEYYFYGLGLGMLILTGFAAYAGYHRDYFYKSWLYIWSGLGFFLGLFGLDATVYLKAVERSYVNRESPFFGIVNMSVCVVGVLVLYLFDQIYSIPALVAAIGAGLGIRIFGVYEYSKRGTFSIVIMGLTLLIVLTLYLVAPQPTGFDFINQLLQTKIHQ